MPKKVISSFHVGVAAEALVAGAFARLGYDVSVQYGANQPEYDLVVVNGDKMLKISVKGSQDGSWGVTANHKKGVSYHEAADLWLLEHNQKTVMCYVQFHDTTFEQMPRMYLIKPYEVAQRLKDTSKGRGDTVLYEKHTWAKNANGYGTTELLPESWRFSSRRIDELLNELNE